MKTENSRRQMTLTDQISEPESFSPMIKSFEKKVKLKELEIFYSEPLEELWEKYMMCNSHQTPYSTV